MKMMKQIVAAVLTALFVQSAFAQIDPDILKKAEAGDALAQFELGQMYRKAALEWYTKAANGGNVSAQFKLGSIYEFGEDGVLADHEKAFKWFAKAADQGLADAQFRLGIMYQNNRGVPQDDKKAAEWFTKAAHQGLAVAQIELSGMYLEGQGVSQDIVTGCAWFYVSSMRHFSYYETACGSKITPEQKAKALEMKDEIIKKIASIEPSSKR